MIAESREKFAVAGGKTFVNVLSDRVVEFTENGLGKNSVTSGRI